MSAHMKINQDVTVGGQPAENEIPKLGAEGFKTIVNFRTAGEDKQPLSPDAEGARVTAAKMEYVHIPVSMESISSGVVDQFREKFKGMEKPVFAHCKSGKRAGAMVMMHLACENGWSGEETLKKAEKMGFECDQQQLIDFVKNYIDSHVAQS